LVADIIILWNWEMVNGFENTWIISRIRY
jgi:hypothetical protein